LHSFPPIIWPRATTVTVGRIAKDRLLARVGI
jgi:hypothetical protein